VCDIEILETKANKCRTQHISTLHLGKIKYWIIYARQ